MSSGKGVTDFPFERGETPPAMRTDFGEEAGNQGESSHSPDNPEAHRALRASQSGRTLEEEPEGSRGPTSQQTLPHLCLMGSRGGRDGTGLWVGIFNFGGHPSVGRPPAFSYCRCFPSQRT